MKDVIKKFKYFGLCNLEKEEAYLNKMSQNGFEFIERCNFIYKFKKLNGPGGTFRIDYRTFNDYKSYIDYIRFLNELDYEKIDRYNDLHYFKTLNNTNIHFLSEPQSKIDILKKLFKFNTRTLIIILLCYISPFILWSVPIALDWSSLLYWGFFCALTLYNIFNIIKKYFRLKKEIY